MVVGDSQGKIQCSQDNEYSDKPASGCVYAPSTGQWYIDVKVCPEGSDDKRSIRNPQNDPHDLGILGIYPDELTSWTAYESRNGHVYEEDE